MRRRLDIALRLSSSALVFSGYLALVSVDQYSMALLLLPLLLIVLSPVGERLDARFPAYREVFKAVTIVYCAFIPFTWFVLGQLNAVIALTIYIQANLMLHQKEERLYHYIFLMSFFLLLAACVQSPEAMIGVALVAFLLSSVWAFCTFRLMVESRQTPDGAEGEIVPLQPRGLAPDTERRSGFDTGVVLNMALVSLASVLLTVVLFLFTPRLEAGWLGRSNTVAATTGLSEEVDLRGGSYVQEDSTAVMLARFPSEPGGRFSEAEMYWRCTTFPKFSGAKWSRLRLSDNLEPAIGPLIRNSGLRANPGSPTELWREQRRKFDLVHQDIYLDQVPEQGVPGLDLVQSMAIHGDQEGLQIQWDRDEDFTVNLTARGARRMSYEIWSEVGDPGAEELRAASTDYSGIGRNDRFLLTYENLHEDTKNQVLEITRDATNTYDRAIAIQSWLTGDNFLYTLDLPRLPEDFAVDTFIMQTRQGHCELFASAMALMLRSLDIPTRVVSGYRGGDWDDSARGYTVRQYMAHLWVEVYFPEFGWVRFDPSPGNSDFSSRISELKRRLSNFSLKAKMFWYQRVVGFSGGVSFAGLRNLSTGLVGGFLGLGDDTETRIGRRASSGFPVFPLLSVLGLMGLAVFLAFRRKPAAHAARKRVLTPDQARAVQLYTRLRKRLVKFGADCYGKTAEEVREDLVQNRWVDVAVAVGLLETYNEVRFGGRAFARDQYTALVQQVKQLRPTPSSPA